MRIWSSWEPEPSALGVALGEPVPA
jgi:hypothetical protein